MKIYNVYFTENLNKIINCECNINNWHICKFNMLNEEINTLNINNIDFIIYFEFLILLKVLYNTSNNLDNILIILNDDCNNIIDFNIILNNINIDKNYDLQFMHFNKFKCFYLNKKTIIELIKILDNKVININNILDELNNKNLNVFYCYEPTV